MQSRLSIFELLPPPALRTPALRTLALPLLALLALLSGPKFARAAVDKPDCTDLALNEALSREHSLSGPVQQWLDWEFTPSIPGLDQEFRESRIPLALIPASATDVLKIPDLPKELEALFLRGDHILWPKHPFNTVEGTPFFKAPEIPSKLRAYHTASRSMVTQIDGKLYGLKMPTNHPFGPSRVEQMNKAFPKDSMRSSMRRTEIIGKIDAKLGIDPELLLLKDILTITDKISGHGFSIRDLRPLAGGHFYFPAHLIPAKGAFIAAKNGVTSAEFFKTAWAAPLGRFQAKMLIRYGIESNPINPQNFLIELDANYKPTGRLACRDLGDFFMVESVSRSMGLEGEIDREKALGIKTFATAAPGTKSETMTWGFNLSGKEPILPVTREAWYSAHDEAFLAELRKLTGIDVPRGYGTYAIEPLLGKPENREKLLRFHQK